jgi:signal transduction histidine kinase
MIEIG